jgi:ribonuclease BN (tRNA processing enzyme)
MGFTLTVLTCEAGRTSGYLLQHHGRSILVDCGPGVTDALQHHIPLSSLDAVVITHSHADHCLDLMGLAYALRFPDPRETPVPLWVPPDMTGLLAQLDDQFGVPSLEAMRRPIQQTFQIGTLTLDSAAGVDLLGDLQLTARPALHAVPSAALRFTDGASAVAFSSDTGPTDTVTAAADSTDLFVCEATYLKATDAELIGHGHLTAELAGRIADRASTRQLVLTHLATPANGPQAGADAARAYTGKLDVAARGARYTT